MWCDYHQTYTHNTNECEVVMQLTIEAHNKKEAKIKKVGWTHPGMENSNNSNQNRYV